MLLRMTASGRWLRLETVALRLMEAISERWGRSRRTAPHLLTGLRGEREALLHLRALGYTVVAQRWKSTRLRGDVDLIAWEKDWLCFVEVKTRSERNLLDPAEAAVDRDKQRILRRMARVYLRSFPEERRLKIPVRFDVISVYLQGSEPEFDLLRGAFGWR